MAGHPSQRRKTPGAGWQRAETPTALVPPLPGPPPSSADTRDDDATLLAGLIHPMTLHAAKIKASAWAVPIHAVLLADGVIDEAAYARYLATLAGRDDPPARADHAHLLGGSLPKALGLGTPVPWPVQTPHRTELWFEAGCFSPSAWLQWLSQQSPAVQPVFRPVPRADLVALIRRRHMRALMRRAILGLDDARPDLSARRGLVAWQAASLLAFLGILPMIAASAPLALIALASLVFAPAVMIKFAAVPALFWSDDASPPSPLADDGLPVYTILVPLHREAAVVGELTQALRALDYPAAKLDIKLILEADDHDTAGAIAALRLPAMFETIRVPRCQPRTKPKALNFALPFARGAFVAVFDAEDRPEAGQLRAALTAFAAAGPRCGCIQARLAYDNRSDSLLTRLFYIEYVGHFDGLLPAFRRLGVPVPLGGTSNHFRRSVLTDIGGWDPFNVTEDADLGLRLARAGYSTGIIASTTWEEAVGRTAPWLRQRTRWLKGWMQTYLVHSRDPARLRAELGTWGAFSVHALFGGGIVALLAYPLALILFMVGTVTGLGGPERIAHIAGALGWTLIAISLAGSVLLALYGLKRRRTLGAISAAFLLPAYWLLMAFAAYRALWQIMATPFHWEKTTHGLAKRRERPPNRGP